MGANLIEIHTGAFAKAINDENLSIIDEIKKIIDHAISLNLKINAGHDLNLDNISFFKQHVPFLDEVSIGHALISESLYMGLQNVVNMYLHRLA